MTVFTQDQPPRKGESTTGRTNKRVLIEASKLADEKMDGIKRYVVELLTAISKLNPGDSGLEIDVMILDSTCPLSELSGGSLASEKPASGQRGGNALLQGLGGLIPPILIYPIRWLIPGWASRRFLGKEKKDLQAPVLNTGGGNLAYLVLPPFLSRYLWGQGFLDLPPKKVDPDSYDLVHLTLPNNLHYIRKTSTPMLVTVHDLCHVACPRYQTRANSITLRKGLDRAVRRGDSFLAVSDATRKQLIEEYALPSDRVSTAHNGCRAEHFYPVTDTAIHARACRKYEIPDAPFLLALSTIEPRKNLSRTIEAFELLAHEPGDMKFNLVIAGARGWKSHRIMRAAKTSRHIHLTGYIADADLAAIYSAAHGFVYVSHYEGFGLPLLEAMRCGLPVIYGNNSSMPEIVGEAGLAADPADVGDIARQMRRLISEDKLAESLGRQALERAVSFSWEQTAEQTLAAYQKLLR